MSCKSSGTLTRVLCGPLTLAVCAEFHVLGDIQPCVALGLLDTSIVFRIAFPAKISLDELEGNQREFFSS